MAAPQYPQYPPGGPQYPQAPDPELERIFALQKISKPWFVSLIENIREAINPPQLPPLQVTARPMTKEELLASDDPMLRRVAELDEAADAGLLSSLKSSLKELFSPTQLPPLQVTARPLTQEELAREGTFGDIDQLRRANLPWFKTFWGNLKELISPAKLPPLELTSKPVQVRELLGRDEFAGRSRIMSVLVHVGLVTLAFAIGTNKSVQNALAKNITVFAPDISPYTPQMKVKPQTMGGGGGGGDRSPTPPSKGKLPRPSLKQFTPPMAVVNNPNPKLVMEPTIIAPPDVTLPQVNLPNYGDPFAKVGPPSNGPGSGGGIGTGSGRWCGLGPWRRIRSGRRRRCWRRCVSHRRRRKRASDPGEGGTGVLGGSA